MIKKLALLSAVLLSTTLSGCASMPGGFGGLSEDPMAMLIVVRSDHKPLAQAQYILVQDEAKYCGLTIDKQMSSLGEAVLTDAVVGYASGAVGLATGASAAFHGNVAEYGKYGGDASAVPNAVGGATKWSYAKASAMGQCVEIDLRGQEQDTGNTDYHDVHVITLTVKSNNRTDRPASGLVPDWKGPKAGTTESAAGGSQ